MNDPASKNIEVEIRSFIDGEQYKRLLEFFTTQAELLMEDEQETLYLQNDEDIRLQRGKYTAKMWMKSGDIHDEAREETEVQFNQHDFDKVLKIFLTLGHRIKIKWLRHRLQYDWDGINVSLDDTKGYGKILELEKLCTPDEQEETLATLRKKMTELNVLLTPREEFDKRFHEYERNWHTLI